MADATSNLSIAADAAGVATTGIPWGSIISGGASILGGILGNSGAKAANREARREAQRNRDWQERMSSTAHQREIKDLRAAGLNPILSGTGGSGATSAPSGATAPQSDEITPALSSALNIFRTMVETQKIEAETNRTKAETLDPLDYWKMNESKVWQQSQQGEASTAQAQKAYAEIPLVVQDTRWKSVLEKLEKEKVISERVARQLMGSNMKQIEQILTINRPEAEVSKDDASILLAFAKRLFGTASPLIPNVNIGFQPGARRK